MRSSPCPSARCTAQQSSGQESTRAGPDRQHYRRIVALIEKMARELTDKPLHIDDICRAAGVSQRTLRNAFQAIYGSSPYRHLRTMRLGEARKALLSPASPTQTVTEVAMHFGFLELGRFSVEYRRTFGECPSATLRRAVETIQNLAPGDPARMSRMLPVVTQPRA
ncbi:MAG: helix-turn-helix domain-containing protein [Xanthobacteraceae bacterium]|nr:helix-turn-helix domain-containing protein [Xanthobacteraceae bacterium]